ncbi:MAG: hypothetical protein RR625_04200 [Christensenellaceae bacterium]
MDFTLLAFVRLSVSISDSNDTVFKQNFQIIYVIYHEFEPIECIFKEF